MRKTLSCVAVALTLVAFGAASSGAQERRYEERGPVPAPGMVAIGGSFGAGTPSEPSFSDGMSLTANVEGYLTRRVSLRAQIGGAWWDIQNRGFNGTVRPLALDGNVVYNFEGGRIHPYVTGGVGLYHYRFHEIPTTGSADKPGMDVGAGIEYFLRRHVTFTGEMLFHAVAQPVKSPVTTYGDTHYWDFTVGLKRYF